jgi:hypothetical protein
MPSPVDIANQALTFLGQDTIIALDEENKAARLCNANYELIRDEVLEEFDWNCASERASLAQDSSTPEWGFDYQYQLPTTPLCLMVREVYEEEAGYEWKVEGQYVVTDAETCNIRYTKQLTSVPEMSGRLRQAIAFKLASHIAFNLTGSAAMSENALKAYYGILGRSHMIDGGESGEDHSYTDPWISAGN